MWGRLFVAVISAVVFCGCATNQTGRVCQSSCETSRKPVVLIVGDSISRPNIGFFKPVEAALADDYTVLHNPGNAEHSRNIVANIDEWLDDAKPDIVHINCGLHDIKLNRETGLRQIEFAEYEANLNAIMDRIKAKTDAKVIWATTTPVNFEWHRKSRDYDRRQEDVKQYNKIALRVMASREIEINALNKVITDAGIDSCLRPDGVHMNEKGNALLAAKVAAVIRATAGK